MQTAFVYTLNALANEVTYYVKTFEQSGTFVILINIKTELSFGIDGKRARQSYLNYYVHSGKIQ